MNYDVIFVPFNFNVHIYGSRTWSLSCVIVPFSQVSFIFHTRYIGHACYNVFCILSKTLELNLISYALFDISNPYINCCVISADKYKFDVLTINLLFPLRSAIL